MRKIYTSIDIGTNSIKFVVGEYFNHKVYVLASHSVNSKGVKKGLIVEPGLVIEAIQEGIKEINDMLGIEIRRVLVNVPDYNVSFKEVSGSIDIRDSEVITASDVNRVIKDSIYNQLDDNYELVTMVPIEYKIDHEQGIRKPIGKKGQKLEIKGIMVSTPKKNIYSVLSVLEGAGLEVVDITITGLTNYHEVRDAALDKKDGAIINLGHATTTVSIFDEGTIVANETLQIGGVNVERDLAYVFGISIFDGRTLKEKFASSHKRFCQINEIYEVKNTVGESIKLNQLEVSEVVMSRMMEILNLAKKQIRLLTDKEIQYIVLTGGLTEIKAFKNLAYEIFGKDVIIYTVTTLGCRDNKYVDALGMIKYFIDKMESRGKNVSMLNVEEETALVTPNNKLKKDNDIVNKLFGNFMTNKEEK
ncbi:MAG: cell division protein FtsA [Bacilli bacterium]|nr:cell division protein FtsA [Bacilli bacterium]